MKYLFIFSLLLVGCERANIRPAQEAPSKSLNQSREADLVRYEDLELEVVCYRVRGFEGLSCMRKNERKSQD